MSINYGVLGLLGLFAGLWLFTRSNVANILLIFPIIFILIYIYLDPGTDKMIGNACIAAFVALPVLTIARIAKRT